MTRVDIDSAYERRDVECSGRRKIHQEDAFERYISRKVAALGGAGWALSPDDTGFDPNDALVFDDFVAWLEATAPEKLDKMRREKGARWEDQLRRALVKSLERNGTVLTLRKGFQIAGYQTIECMAGYPDDERVPGARERYDANILRFMHQVHYQTAGSKSLDFVLFVNGIPVATGEVKTELTQTVRDAIDEYADERKPVEPDGGRKNPLLMYKRGAVVHFAVSEDEVWMCTNLGPFPSKSARPRFLPFNLGRDGGAGNPDAPEGEYRTHYLWDTILQRDNWLSIFDRFVFEEVEDRQDASGADRRPRSSPATTSSTPRGRSWPMLGSTGRVDATSSNTRPAPARPRPSPGLRTTSRGSAARTARRCSRASWWSPTGCRSTRT